MHLQQRIDLLVELGKYISSENKSWQNAKQLASAENSWFTPEFIGLALSAIANEFLERKKLEAWIRPYDLPDENSNPMQVGLVMPGNIPLAGFHDFLSVFISGHRQIIKPSSKDNVLIRHLIEQFISWDENMPYYISFAGMLKGCDAYIATGSNNSSRYFEYYFGKYLHLIRHNRTSVAILQGTESREELENLAGDVHFYFGLGCRNVTKLYVPLQYDFIPLLEAFRKFDYLADHFKYKNNYDYQLAILILNNKYYMTNGSIILSENRECFSPISMLHFEYYDALPGVSASLRENRDIQCVIGKSYIPFGQAQKPRLNDYADGIDSLQFLLHPDALPTGRERQFDR